LVFGESAEQSKLRPSMAVTERNGFEARGRSSSSRECSGSPDLSTRLGWASVQELKADSDKLTRALLAANLPRRGRIFLPRTAGVPKGWLDAFLDELAEFDKGRHDDMVDATAYAARVAEMYWVPGETTEQTKAWNRRPDPNDPLERAFAGTERIGSFLDIPY
jgi:hypothetical protein